jgi:hypothetical protein
MSCRHALVGGHLLRGISAQLNEIRRVLVFTLLGCAVAGKQQTLVAPAKPCTMLIIDAELQTLVAPGCACIPATLWHQRVIRHQLASESSNASQPVAPASQPASQPASHATAGHVLDVEAQPLRRRPALVQRALASKGLQGSRAVEQCSPHQASKRALVQRAIATTALAWRGRRRLSRF